MMTSACHQQVYCYLAVIFKKLNIFDVLQGESDVLTVGEKLLFKRNLWEFCESVAKYNVSVLATKTLITYIYSKNVKAEISTF